MPNVHFDFRRGAGSAPEILFGTVSIKATSYFQRGTSLVLPAPTTLDLVDGEATATNVAPSPAPVDGQVEWAYVVTAKDRHGKSFEWIVGVPFDTGTVEFASLPRYFETKPPLFGQGPKGDPGEAATIEIGSVTSGETPSITNSGTANDAVLDFILPKGDKGDKGDGITTVSDNISATNAPDTYPEGVSITRITSTSAMGDWGGYRGFVVTNRKGSYVEQTYTGVAGEGTKVRTSNNGTTWTDFISYASTELATTSNKGLLSAADKAKLDANNTLPVNSKKFVDLPSTYPPGLSITRGSTTDSWPNFRPDGGVSEDTVVTVKPESVNGGTIQLVKDYYRNNTPVQLRQSTSTGEWSSFETLLTLESQQFTGQISWGVRGLIADGVSDDSVAIQAAVNSTPSGATLTFPNDKTMFLDSPITLPNPIRIVGGNFYTPSGQAFIVRRSDTSIEGVTITGPGVSAGYAIRNHAIHVENLNKSMLKNIRIIGNKIYDMRDSGIWMERVQDFQVLNNVIDRFIYTGIMVVSGWYGDIRGNTIRDGIWNGTSECYGIAMTGETETTVYISKGIVVTDNRIFNIRDRTGIDTHGGDEITVANNQVYNCKTGITGTVGNYDRYSAPQRMVIQGNTIMSDPAYSAGTTVGIALGGADNTHPLGELKADMTVIGNIIRHADIPINLPGARGEAVDRSLSIIMNNSADTTVITIP